MLRSSFFRRGTSAKRGGLTSTFLWILIGFFIAITFQYSEVGDSYIYSSVRPERKVEHTKLAVVMPFSKWDVETLLANLDTWSDYPPCKRVVTRVAPTFYFYSPPLSPDVQRTLDTTLAELSRASRRCFQGFKSITAMIAGAEAHDTPELEDRSWLADQQFYQLMNGSVLPEEVSHIFLMEPGTRPIRSGWLDQLDWTVQTSEPFWIRGSSYRSPCANPMAVNGSSTSECQQLGPKVSDHINANAIYTVGDPAFRNFIDGVHTSEVGSWPFDVAWLRYLHSPAREQVRRPLLKNFVYSDLVQHIGSATFDIESFQLNNPWTFLVHQVFDKERTSQEALKARELDTPIDPDLQKLLKARASPLNNVMIAFGTKNYLDVTENFVHFVRNAKIDNFILVAMDRETAQFAAERGIPFYPFLDDEIAALGGSDSYKSEGFRRIVNKRSRLISTTLRAGFNVLQSDVDIVWLKNPFNFFFKGEYEYEIQSDARVGFSEKDPAAPFVEFVNSGLFYARGTPRMADFYDTLIASVSENPKIREQHLLNLVLQENVLRIKYRIMDPVLFPNGFQYFARALSNRANVEPFCVHNNWLDGGAIKQYRFREINKWVMDPPDYFSKTSRTYLAYYEPAIPNNGWNNVRNSLRAGLAMAQILNRTLILPKFYSHHNKSATVTLDYYIDYSKFTETIPDFRESSFTGKVFPEKPNQIFHIDIGQASLGPLPPDVPLVNFTAKGYFRGATDEEIKTWLEPYSDEPILRLTSAFRRFHKFLDPEKQEAFDLKLQTALTPSPFIVTTSNFIRQKMDEASKKSTGVSKWNCAHIRRGDFPSVHTGEKNVDEIADLLETMLPSTENLYITSDESDKYPFRKTFREHFPKTSFWTDYNRPWFEHLYDPELGVSMRLGAVEQRVCAFGEEFVGNVYSTFSTHICYLRKRMGLSEEKVCKDIYGRKYPLDWEFY